VACGAKKGKRKAARKAERKAEMLDVLGGGGGDGDVGEDVEGTGSVSGEEEEVVGASQAGAAQVGGRSGGGGDKKSPYTRADVVMQTLLIVDSYRRTFGEDLMPESKGADIASAAQMLFEAPFVCASHGTEDEPVFNYGNRAALELWGMGFEDFEALPSKKSAAEEEQEARTALLEEVAREGKADDLRCIRVAAGGRPFRIEGGRLWNLTGLDGSPLGQAVVFAKYTFLEPEEETIDLAAAQGQGDA